MSKKTQAVRYGTQTGDTPMWFWILIAIGSWLGLSLFVGFALAPILGKIGQEISALYETEAWATRPLARMRDDVFESDLQWQASVGARTKEPIPSWASPEPGRNESCRHSGPLDLVLVEEEDASPFVGLLRVEPVDYARARDD